MKVLTISVASYNCESTLEKCLDSMVNSRCIDELEIIVVNDGSQDDTLRIANQYAAKYPQSVIVIDKENGGHGSTINASIVCATGKYYKIVDSDDWVETENLEKLVDFLRDTEVDLAVNSYFEINPATGRKTSVAVSDQRLPLGKTVVFETVALDFDEPQMHKLTFNTVLVKQMGPTIDEHCFYVDVEYVGFLLAKVKTVCFLDYPVYDYLLGYEGQSVSVSSMIKRREQHKKVVQRMLAFFESTEANGNVKEFLRRYIASMVGRQYMIYLHMGSEEGKKECVAFDKTVPHYIFTAPGMGKRMLPLVKMIRLNFALFRPAAWLVKVLAK